jgi:hypothetical protein
MALRTSTYYKNKALDTSSFKTLFTDGLLLLFTGTQPTSADAAATGTLVAVVLPSASTQYPWNGVTAGTDTTGVAAVTTGQGCQWAASASSGVLTSLGTQVWQGVSIATGTIGWFRFRGKATDPLTADSGPTYARFDGSVGTTTGDLLLSVVNITATGQTIGIQSASYTLS